MKTLYLFRHSKPAKQAGGDSSLVPLSQEGRRRFAEFQRKFPIDARTKVFSSPYQRAYETAALTGNPVTVDRRLRERELGDPSAFTKELWERQYTDDTAKNSDGESFRQVQTRMSAAMADILSALSDGEAAVVVSHAAAICAYLQQFCEISVLDAEKKHRKIVFQQKTVLEGPIDTPSCFTLLFSEGLSHLTYQGWELAKPDAPAHGKTKAE